MTRADESLLIRNARVVSACGELGVPLRGEATGTLVKRDNCDVLIRDGVIAEVDRGIGADTDHVIDADGRVLMPAFVDAHTHACWAGDRLSEWEAKLGGTGYLELLEGGGGIMATVRAVRDASEAALRDGVLARLGVMLRHGTLTVEVKSGYGLDTETELKMLRAIVAAGEAWVGTVIPTACIGHALDPDQPDQVERTIAETLPAVHEAFPGIAVDAYCEKGAWSLDDCVRLFERAHELGHPIRVHADQFNSLGMTVAAVRMAARSVDHLEATDHHELAALAESETFGVMLPASPFHLAARGEAPRQGDGRAFLDCGGKLVIATNDNPGSAPCASVPMAIALAVRGLGVTVGEAIGAVTANAAALLQQDDRGRITEGARADLVLLRHRDERALGFEFGTNPVDAVIARGVIV